MTSPGAGVKKLAKCLPGIRELSQSRDAVAALAEDLQRQLTTLQAELESLTGRADELDAALAAAVVAEQKVRHERDSLAVDLSQAHRDHKQTAEELAEVMAVSRALRDELNRLEGTWPAGHYYSPLPDLEWVKANEDHIFRDRDSIQGIDLRTEDQLALVERIGRLTPAVELPEERSGSLRYFADNTFFARRDGALLQGMLRILRPGRMLEVGSGFSSALTLDTNEVFLDWEMDCTFIEIEPERLYSLLQPSDREKITVIPRPVQEVGMELFEELGPGDVLFIDSSHVAKVGSDVLHLYFEVLPRLKPGVVVHIHDIFWPFEYPKEWIYAGRAWNEAYLARAVVSGGGFDVLLFSTTT
jgi:predicted O-methyltransferase YrrM